MSSLSQSDVAERVNRSARSALARFTPVAEHPFGHALSVRHYVLGNGLHVLILVDKTAPVVSYQTWFRVGSRHEKPGKTGLAHLFEHLMFNETKHLPAGEFDRRLEMAGGETNAATWTDWTFYYESLPAAELPLAVELESDRMTNLVLRNPQVRSEKEVVANERRFRVDDDVDGTANETLYALAFRRHPYRWPTIGWMRDIQRFSTADCRRFYGTYYAPNNATLVVAGDCDEADVLARVQRAYGHLHPARLPKTRAVREPRQTRERRRSFRFPTTTEKIHLGYCAPAFGDPDYAGLVLANEALLGGRSSRLFRALVTDGELATDVHGSSVPFRDPGLYEIDANARPGHTARQIERVIDREIDRLLARGILDAELEKAKNRLELSFLSGMETAGGRAEQIGFYFTVLGDVSRVFGRLEEYRSTTREDVLRVARTYLMRSRRSVVTIRPRERP